MIKRTYTSWGGVGIALMALRFAIPFFALMPVRVKENEVALLLIASGILIGTGSISSGSSCPPSPSAAMVLRLERDRDHAGLRGVVRMGGPTLPVPPPVAPYRDPLFEESVRFHG
jgi:hypothetical protein